MTLRHYSPNYVLLPFAVKWLFVQIFTYFMHLQQMDESHQISWSKVTRLNELVAHAQILCNQYVGEGDICASYTVIVWYTVLKCSFIVLQIENNSNHNIFMAVSLFAVLIAVVWRFYSLFLGTTWLTWLRLKKYYKSCGWLW